MPGHFFEDILEHRLERVVQPVAQYAVLFRFFLNRFYMIRELDNERILLRVAPRANRAAR